ncbi:ACT domain-containing protein [Streptomyces sp. NPDC005406]|uniref:ACT domain-containing protein n=1 Tax=Streptomyces sp. NPDC005406 TaxID=3155339 RepID=UPI0034522AC4
MTVIRFAGGSVPAPDRWIALYDADPDHGLDEPGLLAAVLTPLARAAIPVFTASTYHMLIWYLSPNNATPRRWLRCARPDTRSADSRSGRLPFVRRGVRFRSVRRCERVRRVGER